MIVAPPLANNQTVRESGIISNNFLKDDIRLGSFGGINCHDRRKSPFTNIPIGTEYIAFLKSSTEEDNAIPIDAGIIVDGDEAVVVMK